MFGVIGKKSQIEELPQPPSAEEILQDLEIAGPDDIVFTTDIVQLNGEIEQSTVLQGNLQLKKRFETTKESITSSHISSNTGSENSIDLYEKVIAYNQNVEKLETLGKKLNKKVEDLLQSKEELTEDLIKIIEVHSQAVKSHKKINENNGDDN